jgi:hypothetical protein
VSAQSAKEDDMPEIKRALDAQLGDFRKAA